LDKKPSESEIEVMIPIASDPQTREEYINFYGDLRVENVLEDLDACAGNVSHLHASDNNPKTRPLSIVTASFDRIDLLNKLLMNQDLKMRGRLAYVGKSSMEIMIELLSFNASTNDWIHVMMATVTTVATSDGKPTQINRLVPETEQENHYMNWAKEIDKEEKKLYKKHYLNILQRRKKH